MEWARRAERLFGSEKEAKLKRYLEWVGQLHRRLLRQRDSRDWEVLVGVQQVDLASSGCLAAAVARRHRQLELKEIFIFIFCKK